jgi:pimeloyl-ACP methyl ester carboxylesterase
MSQADAENTQAGRYLEVGDLNMYYAESGSGRPLVLLHGGTADSSSWDPLLSILEPHFRVIRPDSRAHGRTNNPLGQLTYPQMADDTATLCRALDLEKPLFIGYSDGGQIALEIGLRHPELPQALVIGGAIYKNEGVEFSFFKSVGIEGPGEVNFAQFEAAEPGWVEMLQATHVSSGDPAYWRTLLRQISALWLGPWDYSPEDLQQIVAPSLILLGDRDDLTPLQQGVDLYRMLPNAELAIIPNATHMSTLTPLCMQMVLDFLLRH